jgi:hypothetical protein
MPLPEWVNRLPKTAPLSKEVRKLLSSGSYTTLRSKKTLKESGTMA